MKKNKWGKIRVKTKEQNVLEVECSLSSEDFLGKKSSFLRM
jgi:hypothetical protein